MSKHGSIIRDLRKRRAVLVLLSLVMVALLLAAACGEEATPTPVPATSTPVPATATPLPPGVTPPPATATPIPPTPTPLPPGVTPPPATATPVPPTATPVPPGVTPPPAPTATPVPTTGLRPISEWTVDNPATREEIEAQLEKHRGESFVFTSWGGAYQGAQSQAWLVPFTEQFGIEIIQDSPVEYAKVRAMAETGNIQWDVVDGSGQAGASLGLAGALEELDFSIIDNRDYLETLRNPWFGGGVMTWSNVVVYNTDTYPEGSAPKTMADIFDVERFPGRRGFGGPIWSWKTSLRFALLSEDPSILDTAESRATLSRLTDEQIDHAFEIMRELKPFINVWWSGGSDCPSLLISGELDICTAWNGRIFAPQQEGAPIKICWECGHLVATGAQFIPKGLAEQDPEKFELAQLWLAWASFPEINPRLALGISYGPGNLKSLAALDAPEYDFVRDALPTSGANIIYGIIEDEPYDGEITDRVGELWTAFQQE